MARIDEKARVGWEELLLWTVASADAVAARLIEKGQIIRAEFTPKTSEERANYRSTANRMREP